MTFRRALPNFELANPIYIGASVFAYLVDANGVKTTTLATLYAGAKGTATVQNPVVCDAEGKFSTPVYFDQPVILTIVGSTVPSHDTGIVVPLGRWRGDWATGTLYATNDLIREAATKDIYVATALYTSGASVAADVTAGNLVVLLDFTDVETETEAAADAALAAKITISTAAPNDADGEDGDLYFRIA